MNRATRTWLGLALPLTFLSVATVLAYRIGLGPWLAYRASRDWQAVPCQIVRAERAISRDDATKWAFHLEYVYEFDGRTFHGTRYSFWNETVHSSPAELPAAQIGPATCFVDPRDPAQAVLSRTLGAEFGALATGLAIAEAFAALIAAGMIVHVARSARRGTVALLATAALVLPAASGEERISPVAWDQPQADVRLAPTDDAANVTFTFRNTSGHEIVLEQIRSACDCFKLTADAERYAPGEVGILSGGFRLGTRSGTVTYRFSVHWAGVAVPDELAATVHFAPVFTTGSAFARWARDEAPTAKEVRFEVVGDARVGRAEVTAAPDWTTVSASVEDAGRVVVVRIVPTSTGKVDLGLIQVSTDHPVRSRSTISAYAWISTPSAQQDTATP